MKKINDSDPRQRVDQLEAQVADFEQLNTVLENLSTTRPVEELLKQILVETLQLCQADQGSILLLGDDSSADAKTLVRDRKANEEKLDHFINTLLSGWVSRHHRSLITNRPKEIFGEQYFGDKYADIASVLAVPLIFNGKVFGVINLVSLKNSRLFDEREERLLRNLAAHCVHFIRNARLHETMFEETKRLKKAVQDKYDFHGIIGRSEPMKYVFSLLDKVIPSDTRVLLDGESGTGKERIARAIHYAGPRKDKPFVAIDCGALPANLLESELFGYRKGAFTGAARDHKGLFEEATSGTLFLDEIVNMPLDIQAKFLRVIQEGEVRPIGSSEVRKIDVRIIAAASQNLSEKMKSGEFREDLFYRLNVIRITIPPLRERQGDVLLLANSFLQHMAAANKKSLTGFAPETVRCLENYSWPGNVRELENSIERLVILSDPSQDKATPEMLPEEITHPTPDGFPAKTTSGSMRTQKDAYEKEILIQTLERNNWNQSAAAKELGVNEKSVRYKMKKFSIKKPA